MIYQNIRKKTDGSYLIDFSGMDYQVTPDYPENGDYCYENVHAYALQHPNEVNPYEDAPLYQPTRLEEIDMELKRIAEQYRTARTLGEAAMGTEYAINRLKQADELAAAPRNERAAAIAGGKDGEA